MSQILAEILKHNNWLNGWYDYQDGDLMAIANEPEKYQQITEVESIEELYQLLQNYEGAFKLKDSRLIFMNSMKYGCFVYKMPNAESYVEHLTMEAISLERFKKIVERLS